MDDPDETEALACLDRAMAKGRLGNVHRPMTDHERAGKLAGWLETCAAGACLRMVAVGYGGAVSRGLPKPGRATTFRQRRPGVARPNPRRCPAVTRGERVRQIEGKALARLRACPAAGREGGAG